MTATAKRLNVRDVVASSSWQNRVAALVFLLGVLVIAAIGKRTPVELLTPDLDRRFVARLRSFLGFSQSPAGGTDAEPT